MATLNSRAVRNQWAISPKEKVMKYNELSLGQIEAIVNKIGGIEEVQRFLSGEIVIGESKIVPVSSNNFNPKEFIGDLWSIQADDADIRSALLTELNLTKVVLRTMHRDGENYLKGEEKLKRLKLSGLIRLDADIFLTLWYNQHLIPKSWKNRVDNNTRRIFFDGTVLLRSGRDRYVLYLYWDDSAWRWDVYWLENNWLTHDPSAVLVS